MRLKRTALGALSVAALPADVDSAGTLVAANQTTQVTITNDFEGVQVKAEVVTRTDPGTAVAPVVAAAVAPAAVTATPAFTG